MTPTGATLEAVAASRGATATTTGATLNAVAASPGATA